MYSLLKKSVPGFEHIYSVQTLAEIIKQIQQKLVSV